MVQLRHADARTVAARLGGPGGIAARHGMLPPVAYEPTNCLILQGTPEAIEALRKAIAALDVAEGGAPGRALAFGPEAVELGDDKLIFRDPPADPRHLKAVLTRPNGVAERYGLKAAAYKSLDGQPALVLSGTKDSLAAGREAIDQAIAEAKAAAREPRTPERVLEAYLEAWIIPYEDALWVVPDQGGTVARDVDALKDGQPVAFFPDAESMYALSTPDGQRQITLREFWSLLPAPRRVAWADEHDEAYERLQAAPEGPHLVRAPRYSSGPLRIMKVYPAEIQGYRAYIWYSLQLGLERHLVAIPDPDYGPERQYPWWRDYWIPFPWRDDVYHWTGSYYAGGYQALVHGPDTPDTGLGVVQANIERNQAVLVRENGEWRLPMRFDEEERKWYLPLSPDPKYFPPAGGGAAGPQFVIFRQHRSAGIACTKAKAEELIQEVARAFDLTIELAEAIPGEFHAAETMDNRVDSIIDFLERTLGARADLRDGVYYLKKPVEE